MFRSVARESDGSGDVLSLHRGLGVVKKGSVDGNHNRTPEDLTRYQAVRQKDVVVNRMKAWQGSAGVAPQSGIISAHYLVFEPLLDAYDSRFLGWLLQSPLMIERYQRASVGIRTSQWELSRGAFAELRLPRPPLDTQRRIADMLDAETARLDTLIEKKQVAVGSTRARLERLRWDLVTGRSSSSARREVALAWADTLPETWPIVSLQYLITSKYGFPFKSDGFTSDPASTPVVRIRDVVPNRVQTWTEESPHGNVWLDNGDIVIGMDGDFNHVRWDGGRAALNQRVCSVRSSSENLTDDYLTEVLGYPLRHINETVHFTTVKHLSFADLMAEKIPVPPVADQAAIVRELSSERDATERLTSAANRSIELLRLRRQALITAAVTGEIETRGN